MFFTFSLVSKHVRAYSFNIPLTCNVEKFTNGKYSHTLILNVSLFYINMIFTLIKWFPHSGKRITIKSNS